MVRRFDGTHSFITTCAGPAHARREPAPDPRRLQPAAAPGRPRAAAPPLAGRPEAGQGLLEEGGGPVGLAALTCMLLLPMVLVILDWRVELWSHPMVVGMMVAVGVSVVVNVILLVVLLT